MSGDNDQQIYKHVCEALFRLSKARACAAKACEANAEDRNAQIQAELSDAEAEIARVRKLIKWPEPAGGAS